MECTKKDMKLDSSSITYSWEILTPPPCKNKHCHICIIPKRKDWQNFWCFRKYGQGHDVAFILSSTTMVQKISFSPMKINRSYLYKIISKESYLFLRAEQPFTKLNNQFSLCTVAKKCVFTDIFHRNFSYNFYLLSLWIPCSSS